MDAQQMHDHKMMQMPPVSQDSRERLEALLATKKNSPSSRTKRLRESDPISMALMDHPTLTRQEAMEIAEAFGR